MTRYPVGLLTKRSVCPPSPPLISMLLGVASSTTPSGTVVVVETRVPSNYVLDPTPRTIIVRNGSGNSVVTGGNGTIGGPP